MILVHSQWKSETACFCGVPVSVGCFSLMVPIWALPEDVRRGRPLDRKWQKSSRTSLVTMLLSWLHSHSFVCFTVRRPVSLSWVCWWWCSPICTYWRCSPEIAWSLPFFPQEVWAGLCFPPNPLLGCCEFGLHCKSWVQSSAWRAIQALTLYWITSNSTGVGWRSLQEERRKEKSCSGVTV